MTHRTAIRIAPAMVATVSIVASGAMAQTVDSDAGDKTRQVNAIEEIIVTARKREEPLQDTPISISAFSGERLEARHAVSITALDDFTPNLTINSSAAVSGSSQTVSVFIRGIGQTDYTLNTDPGVGIYVDGVYISRSVGALLDMVDLERIEVLRGPQGTLFGRNNVGGAISFTTKRPGPEFGGRGYATVGSDDWLIVGGSLNVPLHDTLSTKLTVQRHTRDGYVRRLSDDLKLGDKDNLSVRGALLWEPSAALSFHLTGDYTRSRENGVPLILNQAIADAPFPAAHNILIAPTLNPALAGVPGGCFGPNGAAIGGEACFNSQWVLEDKNTTAGSYPVYSDVDVRGLSLTGEYDMGAATLKSISAYRELESRFSRDGDGSPLHIQATEDIFNYNQISQELQLLGDGFNGRLNWIAGLYYFREKGHNPNIVDFGYVRFQSGGDVRNRSAAAFAQASYDITDTISLTLGTRYTEEEKRFTPEQFIISTYFVPFFPPFLNFMPGDRLVPSTPVTATASEWTPTANIAFRPTQNLMFYASWSRGFKSGGFTQRIFPRVQDVFAGLSSPPPFDPETVDVAEGGFKLTALDHHLQLNGAYYYTWYNDLQVTVLIGVAPTTRNAAEARIQGFELELEAIPVRGLNIHFGAGYTDARYTALDARVTGITLTSAFPGTSEWTLNAGAAHDFYLTENSTLAPRLGWSYRSSFYFDANNEVLQDGYHTLDGSLTYTHLDQNWSLSLFGKNLSDEEYNIHGEAILIPAGFELLSPARGREWGLRLEMNF